MIIKFCVILILFTLSSESESFEIDGIDSLSLQKQNSTTEAKIWNIKLDIQFSKTLPGVVKREQGADARFRCEAILNFTNKEKYPKNKHKLESTLTESPPDHIIQALMKNVQVYWLKNKTQLFNTSRTKVTTKIDLTNGTINTNLRIKNVNNEDEGDYACVIKQTYEKKQTTRLNVTKKIDPKISFDEPTYASLFPESNLNNTTNSVVEEVESTTSVSLYILEPICQEYVGRVCDPYLRGHFVYIPINTTQATLEQKLFKAISVTKYSNEISTNCEGYAVPSLCYSTFPICRDPISTNYNFFNEAHKVFSTENPVETLNLDTQKVAIQNGLALYYNPNKTEDLERFDFRLNTTVLRRVCKDDCVILETELCQKEYAIAKRHPHIGQQLTLEECNNLPEQDPDCLPIGIRAVISDDECYWENGSGYTGKVGTANSGQQCIEWSKQIHINTGDYLELVGRHSYCRNPGGVMPQPWCFVGKAATDKQLCDIPKCAHKIWIYIVVVFLLVTLTIMGFIICLCYRNKGKSPATIRDINLPNADKNIYGDSRLNSPIEMSELLSGQNGPQPHLTRSVRGNAAIRVPQYSLSQIKFLEELGEGAFGKVYKGAIKSSNETTYVAVKALKENASAKTKADFRREIDLISELKHDNIVCIVGVALREEPLCMLFEFMARGDLHEFLMGRAPPAGKGLSALRLLSIAHNIASGMDYLASHHYVHRDLAARNCLVSDDFVVKISDFGLSRDIYSSDYYRVQSKSLLPVRWMPPESILYGKFTTESDIWSYGVVLWEIYSYGLQPYYGFSNQEVIAMVRGGEKLAPPTGCPSALYALMADCWEHTPQRRPNFADIVNRLQGWLESGGCGEAPSESVSGGRHSLNRELHERVPLLPHHFSNGSLTTGSLKKISVPGSSKMCEDARSTCSEVPPLVPKKKHSAGSLIDAVSAKDTVVRIPNAHCGNEI